MDIEGVGDLSGYSQLRCTVACAICGSRTGIDTSHERLQVVGIGTVVISYGYCMVCGHIYQTTPVSDEKLADYYARFGNYTHNLKPCAITERLRSLLKGRGRYVYEVGCGTGRHLAEFRQDGFEVYGCEPSKAASGIAKSVFGLIVDCGTEAECLPNVTDMDVVVLSGVLEHLPDPLACLKRARAALVPDGHVIVEVPCATSVDSLPPGWFAFEHLHYFTRNALCKLFVAAGFRIIEARVNYSDFIYPVITVLAKVDEPRSPAHTEGAAKMARGFIEAYNARDAQMWARARNKLFGIGKHFIWGAGIHTSQLFHRIPSAMTNCPAIIDSDPQKHGQYIGNVPVISSRHYEGLKSELPVVISSFYNEEQIAKNLTGKNVIRLYA